MEYLSHVYIAKTFVGLSVQSNSVKEELDLTAYMNSSSLSNHIVDDAFHSYLDGIWFGTECMLLSDDLICDNKDFHTNARATMGLPQVLKSLNLNTNSQKRVLAYVASILEWVLHSLSGPVSRFWSFHNKKLPLLTTHAAFVDFLIRSHWGIFILFCQCNSHCDNQALRVGNTVQFSVFTKAHYASRFAKSIISKCEHLKNLFVSHGKTHESKDVEVNFSYHEGVRHDGACEVPNANFFFPLERAAAALYFPNSIAYTQEENENIHILNKTKMLTARLLECMQPDKSRAMLRLGLSAWVSEGDADVLKKAFESDLTRSFRYDFVTDEDSFKLYEVAKDETILFVQTDRPIRITFTRTRPKAGEANTLVINANPTKMVFFTQKIENEWFVSYEVLTDRALTHSKVLVCRYFIPLKTEYIRTVSLDEHFLPLLFLKTRSPVIYDVKQANVWARIHLLL